MKFGSTRGQSEPVLFSTAVSAGLAPDGGLYVPGDFPAISPAQVHSRELAGVASEVLAPFFEGDALASQLAEICSGSLSFPVPLVDADRFHILELFHGPTAAFKDVGARFLAECMVRIDQAPRTVLVATSGDTGGAVAAAFHQKPGIEVVILYPQGGVSPEQEQQLTCWGDNVTAFAVKGVFDDCQKLLKTALVSGLGDRQLTTANSINIARLLPQMTYYAYASLCHGGNPTFVVPTGNVGNATAALWAKQLGFPIQHVVMVTNANRTVPDYMSSGDWKPRPSTATLANAMDVGDPSNMERVFSMYPSVEDLRRDVSSISIDDPTIQYAIRTGQERYGRMFDPHTATAVYAVDELGIEDPIVVSTAHPAKFGSVVGPLVEGAIEIPESLVRIRERASHFVEIAPDIEALRRALR